MTVSNDVSPTGSPLVALSMAGRAGRVAVVEIHAGPHNFATAEILHAIVDAFEQAAASGARSGVVCSEGKSFCAGAHFAGPEGDHASGFATYIASDGADDIGPFYTSALRIFSLPIPLVAAVHGPAVGAGFGLATACDLRVICPEAFLATNFVRLGIHPGFGISTTLPELIGPARASDLLLTGRRVFGEECFALGLANRLVPRERVRDAAIGLADEIAAAAPLAVRETRATLRQGLAERVARQLVHERNTQHLLHTTYDAEEGIAALLGRRDPEFTGT